jgi:hypothetical protein
MAAYRYGRQHIGFQALMANALLTFPGALGYVTELLSGDFATPFGRSSHHQVWSEAMVVTPAVRGLLGIEADDGGRTLRVAPALPPNWNHVEARNVRAGEARSDVSIENAAGRLVVRIGPHASNGSTTPSLPRVIVAPALPADAHVRGVTVNGASARYDINQTGDVQRVQVTIEAPPSSRPTDVIYSYDEGTDVYVDTPDLQPASPADGLRIVRARVEARTLRLTLDGRGGREYAVSVRTRHRIASDSGMAVNQPGTGDAQLRIRFEGPAEAYTRRHIAIALTGR